MFASLAADFGPVPETGGGGGGGHLANANFRFTMFLNPAGATVTRAWQECRVGGHD